VTHRFGRTGALSLALVALAAAPGRDTRAQEPEATFERTVADLGNDKPHVRLRAVQSLKQSAPPEAAIRAWDRLLDDPSRAVRRSTVDAIAGVARQELRPLLERALEDDDAWTRWKALRGIGDLGTGPSRAAVRTRASDPDFRVRLEAARVAARDPA